MTLQDSRRGGREARRAARPFVSQSNCFVVPPLRFAPEACRCLEVAVRACMPVFLVSARQAGATSPAVLAGSLVQEIAECLAGLVYVNAVRMGAPAIVGPFCFVSDLRTGTMSGGSPEQLNIDNDIIGATQRITRGIDVSDDSPSVEAIRETCLAGPNHFLGSSQPLARMQKDYLYPLVGDRSSTREWDEKGRPGIIERADRRFQAILDGHVPIRLPRERPQDSKP